MKAFALFACMVASLALSALAIVILMESETVIPEAPPAPLPSDDGLREIHPDQNRAVEELLREIIARQEELERQEQALRDQAAQVQQEHILVNRMLDDLGAAKRDLEERFEAWDEEEQRNVRKIAEFVAKMNAQNAATLLMELEIPRAARILFQLGERQAGGIMDAAVAQGEDGTERAVEWSEAIRQMRTNRR